MTCSICGAPADPTAPLPLCRGHLLDAYDWVVSDVGLSDLLPSPCLACGSRLGVRWPSGWLCAVCEWRVGDLPDDATVPARIDVVYYLRFADRIKIGTTANPRQRLAQLKHDELLAFEPGDRVLEHRRHEQFALERFDSTEWFRSSTALLAHVAVLQRGVSDPWNQYRLWVSERLAMQ